MPGLYETDKSFWMRKPELWQMFQAGRLVRACTTLESGSHLQRQKSTRIINSKLLYAVHYCNEVAAQAKESLFLLGELQWLGKEAI